ncbi:hypothetical protein [Vibrio algivorus]|uniref:Flagellar protein FliL n=1 Tax=Vibrio algivorus TaxID=1667024 RepID=A0A557NV35_9VIBR|nr:hypothetical protein [Vibrio algivorus]TVO32278.1 hypothetical protein FOF44_17160 [Vibrio algivorus]
MMKVIVGVVLGCALLGVGGAALFKPELLPFMDLTEANTVQYHEPLIEVTLHDVLIPINVNRRQKLLLTNLSLFINKSERDIFEQHESKIKHEVLSEFSVKPESYFMSKNFISVFQSDLEAILVDNKDENINFKVKEVLVTKAVYQ